MNEITYIPSPEKWPELHTETRPMFPIQYLPEDCAR